MKIAKVLGALIASVALAQSAVGQAYPSKPLRVIEPCFETMVTKKQRPSAVKAVALMSLLTSRSASTLPEGTSRRLILRVGGRRPISSGLSIVTTRRPSGLTENADTGPWCL